MDLVRSLALKGHEELGIDAEAALRRRVQLGRPAADALGIELGIPTRVQRVGQVDPPSVAAQLDHLRPTVERASPGVLGAGNDAAQANGASQFGIERIADVILAELAGAPAGNVQEAIVEAEV